LGSVAIRPRRLLRNCAEVISPDGIEPLIVRQELSRQIRPILVGRAPSEPKEEHDLQSNAEWQAWGKRDPLWGVASWPGREKGGANPWNDEEFYALGLDWSRYDRAWRNASGGTGRSNGTVVEIGCGAGRITGMLALTFQHVIAGDVSPDIIEYARAHVPLENIRWLVTDGDVLPAEDGQVDAVFSCQVFQHFPNNAAQLAMFREISRVLKPGGTFFIHQPMHCFPHGRFAALARTAYAAYLQLQRGYAFVQLNAMRFGGRPPMRIVSYEMDRLLEDLRAIGFADLQVVHSPHTCMYGRRT
jgi:SAM-dependent methyltransferase